MPSDNMAFIQSLISKSDCTVQQGRAAVKVLINEWEQEFNKAKHKDGDDYLLSFVYREWVADNA